MRSYLDLAFMGALTLSNRSMQGRLTASGT